ncbi:outer membrane putative beta-barrel porin/alpha-amylase [Acinetobacter calcoaceticus]|uniref:Outer membrane putative beta-barrel porin/alpha-amylase n=1 Tax=Acinetobacter calcoaceticus TaxID=471 RepID=A0A4R1Y1P5_ACICA|nr:outer membrane putative beta-barrel porin/alpha-amylase [Acinetobacter calcoaceticus]
MNILQKITLVITSTVSMASMAAEFSFDRPGTGFGTGITPVGKLAWEQGLPAASYNETVVDGAKAKTVTLNGDMLLRTGLTSTMELQLGWQGPGWTKTTYRGQSHEENGLGDVSIGIKKAIDLDDDRLTMAVLAQAQIATGNDQFTADKDIYSLGSTLDYQYNDLLNTSMTMYYEVQDGQWSVTAVPTLSYKLTDKWTGFSEFVYSKKESNPYAYSLGSGVIYALSDRTQLDASFGVDLNGDDRNFNAGLGFAFLF